MPPASRTNFELLKIRLKARLDSFKGLSAYEKIKNIGLDGVAALVFTLGAGVAIATGAGIGSAVLVGLATLGGAVAASAVAGVVGAVVGTLAGRLADKISAPGNRAPRTVVGLATGLVIGFAAGAIYGGTAGCKASLKQFVRHSKPAFSAAAKVPQIDQKNAQKTAYWPAPKV